MSVGANYIVVADLFAEDYAGGAELTLDALLSEKIGECKKVHSAQVDLDFVQRHKDKYWILGNIAQLSKDAMIEIATTTKYSKIECDYFYCKYRSSHLHKIQTGRECGCNTDDYGRFVLGIYKRAQHVFFMSEGQLEEHRKRFPVIRNWPTDKLLVQGSTFSKERLDLLLELSKKYPTKNGKHLILGGSNVSWIKNEKGCIEYCKTNNLDYDVVGGKKPEEFLEILAQYKGLVFLPIGFDTNPRITIEAKILGLDLILNDNVQQRYDTWFNQDQDNLLKHLYELPKIFWNKIP